MPSLTPLANGDALGAHPACAMCGRLSPVGSPAAPCRTTSQAAFQPRGFHFQRSISPPPVGWVRPSLTPVPDLNQAVGYVLVILVSPRPAAMRRKMCVICSLAVVTAEQCGDTDMPVLILGLGNTVVEKADLVSCLARQNMNLLFYCYF